MSPSRSRSSCESAGSRSPSRCGRPGHDEELALGFALSEGLRPLSARVPDDLAANTIELEAPGFDPERIARSFYTTSSCGVCGKGALEAIAVESQRVESALTISGALVGSLPDRLREAQAAFDSTGGLHATGLFTAAGELVCAREDVGRHNAMDKVIGRAFLDGLLPLADHVLCVSGRLSFELVQKAAVAGCPVVVAVGAPSSLAVELAADRGITLCGFVRDGRCNVYSRPERITRLRALARASISLGDVEQSPRQDRLGIAIRPDETDVLVVVGATSGTTRIPAGTSNTWSHAWASTLDQCPSRTWANIVEIEFVSTVGRGSAPASWKMLSRIRRFCMSPVRRQRGSCAASAQVTSLRPASGPSAPVSST